MSEGAEARQPNAVAGSATHLARQDRSSGAEQQGATSEGPEPVGAAIIMDEIREDWALTLPIIAHGRPLHDNETEDASGASRSTCASEKTETTLPVLIVEDLEARPRKNRRTVFETRPCAEVVEAALGARWTFVDAAKPFLTTREATVYCGFKTAGALRKAKLEGRIVPAGRRGGRGTFMWSRETLDRYLHGEPSATVLAGRARTLPEANGGTHEERTVGSEMEQLGESQADATRRLSTKGGRVSGSRASHRSEDGIDAAGCPKPAGTGGTRGGTSLVEDGARLDPQERKPADDQATRALSDLRRFFAARKS
jgi:hypothetical protein